MASVMTSWSIRRSPAQPAALPSTTTSLRNSSTPAEVLATLEKSDQSWQIAVSVAAPDGTSPSATATPSAEAPRDSAIEW